MAQRSATGWLGGLAGLALVAAAAWFGIDLDGSGEKPGPTASPAPRATATAGDAASASGLETCPLDTLPTEAADTVEAVRAGGPFEHPDNDGTRFGNYEGRLPDQARDYYREYTVDTPGLNHRGTRRIVTGGSPADDPEVWFYTGDHYETFCEIPL